MALQLQPSPDERIEFKVYSDRPRLRTDERFQFIDLTELVVQRVRRSGVSHGTVNIQTRHTTTAVLVNENEPLLVEDIKDLLRRLASRESAYRHDDLESRAHNAGPDERTNGHAHARAVLLGTSETLNVVDGEIELGQWQRIFLVELDGPQPRHVSIAVMGLSRSGSNGVGTVWAEERTTLASVS